MVPRPGVRSQADGGDVISRSDPGGWERLVCGLVWSGRLRCQVAVIGSHSAGKGRCSAAVPQTVGTAAGSARCCCRKHWYKVCVKKHVRVSIIHSSVKKQYMHVSYAKTEWKMGLKKTFAWKKYQSTINQY